MILATAYDERGVREIQKFSAPVHHLIITYLPGQDPAPMVDAAAGKFRSVRPVKVDNPNPVPQLKENGRVYAALRAADQYFGGDWVLWLPVDLSPVTAVALDSVEVQIRQHPGAVVLSGHRDGLEPSRLCAMLSKILARDPFLARLLKPLPRNWTVWLSYWARRTAKVEQLRVSSPLALFRPGGSQSPAEPPPAPAPEPEPEPAPAPAPEPEPEPEPPRARKQWGKAAIEAAK